MSSPAPARPGGAAFRVLAAGSVVVVVLVVALLLSHGRAPARFEGTRPADGSVLAAAPAEVVLAFSGTPDVRAAHISVAAPDGSIVSGAAAAPDGHGIVVPVGAAGPGSYRIGYHVELAGGDPVAGVATYTVAPAAAAGPAAPGPAPAGAHVHTVSRDPATAALLLLDLVLVAALVAVLVRRPRRR